MSNNQTKVLDTFFAIPSDIAPLREFNNIRLKSDHKLIYAYVLSFRLSGNKCYANQETISDKTGIARRVVVDVIKDLKDMKLIKVTYRKGISNLTWAQTIQEAIAEQQQTNTNPLPAAGSGRATAPIPATTTKTTDKQNAPTVRQQPTAKDGDNLDVRGSASLHKKSLEANKAVNRDEYNDDDVFMVKVWDEYHESQITEKHNDNYSAHSSNSNCYYEQQQDEWDDIPF